MQPSGAQGGLRGTPDSDQSADPGRQGIHNAAGSAADGNQTRIPMKTDAALETYLTEAASWDADRVAMQQRSARVAWWVAGGGWVCALTVAIALMLLMPLKRVEPFVIRVDNTTGLVDVVPVYAGNEPMPEAVTRYFLDHYVTVCERFNFATAESDYQECGAFHSGLRNQAWYALWNPANPSSPLNLYKDGSIVRAQVVSVSFFKRANGVADLAQVRYVKGRHAAGAADEQLTHWIATVQYSYSEPSKSPQTRSWNPLGFKVIDFRPEPEVTGEASAAAGATRPPAAIADKGPQP
jgi:type IV secretion system protein VirB8